MSPETRNRAADLAARSAVLGFAPYRIADCAGDEDIAVRFRHGDRTARFDVYGDPDPDAPGCVVLVTEAPEHAISIRSVPEVDAPALLAAWLRGAP